MKSKRTFFLSFLSAFLMLIAGTVSVLPVGYGCTSLEPPRHYKENHNWRQKTELTKKHPVIECFFVVFQSIPDAILFLMSCANSRYFQSAGFFSKASSC